MRLLPAILARPSGRLLTMALFAVAAAAAPGIPPASGPDPAEIPVPPIAMSGDLLPGVAALPVQAALPDPLVMPDGTRVTSTAQWQSRRVEIKRTLEYYAIGRLPPPPGNVRGVTVTNEVVLAGRVHYRLIHLTFGPQSRLSLDLGLFTPARRAIPHDHSFRFTGPRNSETLDIMQKKYPNWFSPHLHEFWGQREKLPFDEHWFLALCAPRPFIALEGDADHISLPEAVRQSILGAQPVYDLFGARDRLGVNYARHAHAFIPADWTALMDFADKYLRNMPVQRTFDRFPTEAELNAASALPPSSR